MCNEYCKYYKNVENPQYKFIPMVHRVFYDGSVSHVTGIVSITAEEYEAMPKQFDGEWLRGNFPSVAESMDRFIDKIKQETNGELVGDLEIIRIPLNLYRARNATSRQWPTAGRATTRSPPRRCSWLGDSAIGSPYFQSISLGFECAMFLAGLIAQPRPAGQDMLDRYELYIYKQWLRVYMQSKMIKNNKDLFQSWTTRSRSWTSCTSTTQKEGVTVALTVGQPVSDHTVQAYLRGEPAPIVFELSSHRGSWVVLFFYPGDFTLICPTELAAFAKRHDDFLTRTRCCSRRARTAPSATRRGSRRIRGSRRSAIR